MTLGEAIEELIRQYDKACALTTVDHPVTWALQEAYQVASYEDMVEEMKADANR